jgi:hypothetical protein
MAVIPSTYGTAKKKTVVDKTVRVLLTDPSFVQKLDSTTMIGRQVGVTNVYALAHNGNVRKISVNVVDYAKPKSWMNLDILSRSRVLNLFTERYDDFTDIVSWLSQHNEIEGDLLLNEKGELLNERGISLGEMEPKVIGILSQFQPPLERMVIGTYESGVRIDIKCDGGTYTIAFHLQIPYDESKLNGIYTGLKLADHWMCQRFVGA